MIGVNTEHQITESEYRDICNEGMADLEQTLCRLLAEYAELAGMARGISTGTEATRYLHVQMTANTALRLVHRMKGKRTAQPYFPPPVPDWAPNAEPEAMR